MYYKWLCMKILLLFFINWIETSNNVNCRFWAKKYYFVLAGDLLNATRSDDSPFSVKMRKERIFSTMINLSLHSRENRCSSGTNKCTIVMTYSLSKFVLILAAVPCTFTKSKMQHSSWVLISFQLFKQQYNFHIKDKILKVLSQWK